VPNSMVPPDSSVPGSAGARDPSSPETPFNVVVAGGGVAGLEAALALRELGGESIATTLLAPNPEFVYRPLTVREPFGYPVAKRYQLEEIARDIGVNLLSDGFKWLDSERHRIHTEAGDQLPYDALLFALGTRLYTRFKHALTIDDGQLDEQLHGLIQDIEGGYVRRLAFIAPGRIGWPLPIYELAMMTATRAQDMNIDLSITIATPEDAPLAVFGLGASEAVRRLLATKGIETITSAYCEVHAPGRVTINPGSRELQADRIVAMPELLGPSVAGIPGGSAGGFIPIDIHCKVPGVESVYAAGDATDFAIKHGGIAAQQADVAAQAIAAAAGVGLEPAPFCPVIHAILLTGDKPLYLSAHVTGGHGSSSEINESPPWSPGTKIAAKYLGPYLQERDRVAGSTR
jgi:sulfide:quinone oxidoreductase